MTDKPEHQHTPQMWNVQQASDFLNMPIARIKVLCQQRAQATMGENRLPHFRVGRALYFTKSSLVGWIQKMKKSGI